VATIFLCKNKNLSKIANKFIQLLDENMTGMGLT